MLTLHCAMLEIQQWARNMQFLTLWSLYSIVKRDFNNRITQIPTHYNVAYVNKVQQKWIIGDIKGSDEGKGLSSSSNYPKTHVPGEKSEEERSPK